MASHAHLRFLLKTPAGYLTTTGATDDICNPDIIILNIYGIGGCFSPKKKTVENFLSYSSFDMCFTVEQCKVLVHACSEEYYKCNGCPRKNYCDFLNNRTRCEIRFVE